MAEATAGPLSDQTTTTKDEELKNVDVDDLEDLEEDGAADPNEPSGAGELPLLLSMPCPALDVWPLQQKRRRRRRSLRKRRQSRAIRLEWAYLNSTLTAYILRARYRSTRTSELPIPSVHSLWSLINIRSNTWRTTSEEKRYIEREIEKDPDETYQNIRRAAEVHRLVRQHARKHIKPGMTMTEIVNNIEDGTRALVEENGMESGVGFPTGVSLNNCAAHYTPNAGDTMGACLVPSVIYTRLTDSLCSTQAGRCSEGRLRCSRQGAHRRFSIHDDL